MAELSNSAGILLNWGDSECIIPKGFIASSNLGFIAFQVPIRLSGNLFSLSTEEGVLIETLTQVGNSDMVGVGGKLPTSWTCSLAKGAYIASLTRSGNVIKRFVLKVT